MSSKQEDKMAVKIDTCENYPKIINKSLPELSNKFTNKIKILVNAPFSFLEEEKKSSSDNVRMKELQNWINFI